MYILYYKKTKYIVFIKEITLCYREIKQKILPNSIFYFLFKSGGNLKKYFVNNFYIPNFVLFSYVFSAF